jgi:hypothetical protein
MPRTRITTANVLSSLSPQQADECLATVLAGDPDIVGLQEWRIMRLRGLARTGSVGVAGVPRLRTGSGAFTWVTSGPGDCVVGLRASRFTVLATRQVSLGTVGHADRGSRILDLLPPRWVSVVEAEDHLTAQRLGIVSYHLIPGTQGNDVYRADRPRNARRHQQEVRRLQRVVSRLLRRCDAVCALGDSNFHGLALPPLHSAWEGHPGTTGTLTSHRRIDDVFFTEPSRDVQLLRSHSDHAFVQVDY